MTNTPTHQVTLSNGTKLAVMKTEYGFWSDDLKTYIDAREITSQKTL